MSESGGTGKKQNGRQVDQGLPMKRLNKPSRMQNRRHKHRSLKWNGRRNARMLGNGLTALTP